MASKKKTIPEQIKKALITQKVLAALIDVSDATFTRKMADNKFSKEELSKIEGALRVKLQH